MINQNHLFDIFGTKYRSSNNKNIKFQIWEYFIDYTSKKWKKTIEQKKHVGGSSAVPRVRLNILGTCTGTRTLTKVLESAPSDRQTERPTITMVLFTCFLMPNN